MWINNYPEMIAESPEELLEQERRLRGSPLESRVKMLRLLKSGHYCSRRSLADVLGYSSRQLGRWWKNYRHGGLDALLEYHRPPGKQERITEEALDALEEQMKQGNIARLEESRLFLAEQYGIHYEGVSGLSRLFDRHQTKLKTGRRRHRKASEAEQEAFKK
ncbi:MAG: helix-turn-helix domain-containing protein [Rubrobacter sp.]|nr:helix-turn-helix domain-containing protein [Rubrobacter sp.]